MLLGKLDICLQKLKPHPCLSACTSIKSKLIKDLIKRPETLKLVHKRAENTLEATGIGDDSLSRTQMVSKKDWKMGLHEM
jgi:hypothetical protein